MFIKFFLLLLAGSLLSAGRLLPQPETRIIGGEDTTIERAPWQVALRFDGTPFCGGSIYSETIIITAAHCLYNEQTLKLLEVANLTVLAGSANKFSSETIVKVAAIKTRTKFDFVSMYDDIGIVKLSAPLDLSTPKMQKIELATEDPVPGTRAQVTGWGEALGFIWPNTQFPLIYSPVYLKLIEILIQEPDTCRKMFNTIQKKLICAGSPYLTTCRGDSGGPMVVGGKLAGVVSYGTDYCKGISVFTSVSQHRDWIEKVVRSM